MDVKDFLKQPRKLDIQIRNKLIERQQLRELAMGISAGMDGIRVRASGGKSRMAEAVDKLVDMEAEIDALVDRLVDTKRQVVAALEALDNPTEYNLLHMRYVQGKSLQEIADAYRREYGWATTTHGRAMRHLRERLDKGQPS